MSFHLKLHKYPAHKKTVITKATTLGEKKIKKGLVYSEYPHQTRLMSFKGLVSPKREGNAQKSF